MTSTLKRAVPSTAAEDTTGAGISRRRELRKAITLAAGAALSVIALVVSVTIGTAGVGIGDVLRSLQVSVIGGTISADFASSTP